MRILSFITAILMLFCLASCSGSAGQPPSETLATLESGSPAPPEEINNEEELTPIYDSSEILEAYRSGDSSRLDEKQLVILKGARSAIESFYREDMSGEEIVIAAHDWLVTTTVYDENMMLAIPHQSPDTENPYGVFTAHQAICMGYTTTFQLFMDMLGVESIIISGSAQDEEHAWNMVKLDGEWYHVDCTWDDFVPDEDGRPPFHTYTLVPDYVMEVMHVWDHGAAPKAEAEDRIYFKSHGTYAANSDECSAILKREHEAGARYAEIMLDDADSLTYDFTSQYWIHELGEYIVVTIWML